MNDWSHGYNVSVGYTFGYYRETAPLWIEWALAARGYRLPPEGRYLELACGQGLNLLLHAACHPERQFLGIDFHPLHIVHARELASSVGLTNVRFLEGDFLELAEDWREGLFEQVALHGLLSWIAPAVQEAVVRLLRASVAPGGVVYLSYNALPGWTATQPLQYLLRRFEKTSGLPPDQAVQRGFALARQLLEDGAAGLRALPALKNRIEKAPQQDPNYLVHEYLHDNWHPFWFGQVVELLRPAKLTWVSTATLPELYALNLLPQKLRERIVAVTDPVFRQELLDLALNQSFRRDLFMRGDFRHWPQEQAERLARFRFVALKAPPETFKFQTAAGEVTGNTEVYRPLVEALQEEPITVEALQRKVGRPIGAVVQALSFLLHGDYVALYREEVETEAAIRLNRALVRRAAKGAPYRFLVLPKIGQARPFSPVEMLLLSAVAEGRPLEPETLAEELLTRLKRLGRKLAHDGKPVEGEAAFNHAIAHATALVRKTVPFLERFGGWR